MLFDIVCMLTCADVCSNTLTAGGASILLSPIAFIGWGWESDDKKWYADENRTLPTGI